MKALHTIIKPVVTEKAIKMEANGVYVFFVNPKATKIDIKNAIKEAYGTEVVSVKIIKTPAKKRVIRKMEIKKRKEMKKAMIKVKGKKKMDISKIVKETTKK